jgi:hypothetical protein
LHFEFFITRRGVEADHVFFEVILRLLFDRFVETILRKFGPEGHDSIGEGDELIDLLDVCDVEMECVGVLGIDKENYFHEEALPAL